MGLPKSRHWCLNRRLMALLAVPILAACGEPLEDEERDDEDISSVTQPLCNFVQLASSSPGPMPPSSSVLLTATGATCNANQTPEYRFRYQRVGGGTGYIVLRGWNTNPTATFSNVGLPSGQYRLEVRARNVGSTQPYDSVAIFTIMSGDVCPDVTLAASPPAPQLPGTRVALTANATCTPGPAEYRFLYRRPGESSLRVLRGWGGPTYSWNTARRVVGDYELVVRARRAGNPSYESSASIPYVLSDRCTVASATATPPPPQPPGTSVTIAATASCAGGGVPQLRYVVRPAGAATWNEIQSWGTAMSAVWATGGLAEGDYELGVEVRAPGLSGDAQGRQTLPYQLAIPNRPPTITSDGGGSVADIAVYENMPPTVTTVVATDPDAGDTVTYTISGGSDGAAFGIHPWGELFFLGGPRDFENPTDQNGDNVFEVEVQASDGTQADTQLLRITVTDVADDPISVSVLEGLTFVTNVVRIHPGLPLPVTEYRITGGADAAHFTIDATTGGLSFLAPPDYETPADADLDNLYEVTVGLLDGFFLEEQRFRVAVTDFSEAGTEIITSIPENTTEVMTVVPRHPVLQQGPVTFTITGGVDPQFFVIDAATGRLSFAQPPDFEWPLNALAFLGPLRNLYGVEVGVTNGSFMETLGVLVRVTDVFEPVLVSVSENQSSAALIRPRHRFTPCRDSLYPCVYGIAGGSDAQHFEISQSGGGLSFVIPWPDYERPMDANHDNVYEVEVAIFSGSILDTETQVVYVTVVDVLDNPGGFAILENTTGYLNILREPGDNLRIVGGSDHALFTLDTSGENGLLSFITAPDFEQPSDSDLDNVYLVSIFSELQGSVVNFEAHVTNVDEPPIFTTDERASVAENTTFVITLAAIDPEGTGTVTYAIAGGPDGSRFVVDPTTGALSFLAAPDFEAPGDANGDNLYDVTVQASDGSLASTWRIGIRVTDVVEADTTASPPVLLSPVNGVANGSENTDIPLGLHAELTDTDGSETLTVTIAAQFGDPMPGTMITDGVHSHTFTANPAEVVDVSTWNVDTTVARQAQNVDADLLFLVTARSTESNGGATAEISTYVNARFYTLGTGVALRALTDFHCQVDPGVCLGGPVGDVDGDGFIDPTNFGRDLGGGGDFNGDGYADLAVGASGASPGGSALLYAGAVYVVFGGPGGLAADANAVDLNGQNGFRLDGIASLDNLGRQVDLSGDLDGDGFDDLIVSGGGRLYVLYGHAGPFPQAISAASAVELYQGLLVQGAPVATADVNGDGLDDLIEGWIDPSTGLGAPGAHVIYGTATRLAGPVDWAAIDGTTQSILVGAAQSLVGGSAVANAGDVNGDGIDDLLIGIAPQGEYGPGTVHVVFGSAAGLGATFDLADLDGTTGFSLTSSNPLEIVGLGITLGSAGDVNGDGYDDIIAGAPNSIAQSDPSAGVTYVIFGHAGSFPASLDLAQLGPAEGFRFEGAEAYDGTGYAVGGAGDVNGDGLGDLVVGALRAAPPGYRPTFGYGDTYVLFGKETGLGPVIDAASLPADAGARLEGGYSITSVSPAGDSDGDGMDEVAIGAPDIGVLGAPGVNGLAYRVRGDTLGGPQPRDRIYGTSSDDIVDYATTLPELIQTLGGNDNIDGGGGDDVILAGPGDDLIVYRPAARRISGGPGFDTLVVVGDLDLTDPLVTRSHHSLDGIEQLDLRDGGPSVLHLDHTALTRLSDERAGPMGQANGLLVLGEVSDTVVLGAGFTQAGTAQHAGTTFGVYRSSRGNAAVWIDQTIAQVVF